MEQASAGEAGRGGPRKRGREDRPSRKAKGVGQSRQLPHVASGSSMCWRPGPQDTAASAHNTSLRATARCSSSLAPLGKRRVRVHFRLGPPG
eukprot:8124993-Alexandrium_andersonii.AAC.1